MTPTLSNALLVLVIVSALTFIITLALLLPSGAHLDLALLAPTLLAAGILLISVFLLWRTA